MDGPLAMTVDDILSRCTFSWFTIKLVFVTSSFYFVCISEIAITTILAPYLRCEWQLSDIRLSALLALLFLGNGVGAVYFGRIGDVYGRKLPMFMAGLFSLYFNFLITASHQMIWFGVLKLFIGILTGGIIVSSVTFLSEFVAAKHRGKAVAAMCAMCSLGNLYIGLMAYLTLNKLGWRIFLAISSAPFLLIILLSIKWFPESIRFLQVTGNHSGVLEALYEICKQSNIKLPLKITLQCKYVSTKGNFNVLSGKRLRKKLILLAVIWTILLMSYYGTTFLTIYTIRDTDIKNTGFYRPDLPRVQTNCSKLSNKEVLEYTLTYSTEFPGAILFLIMTDFVGRKPCLISGFLYLAFVYLVQNVQLSTPWSMFVLLSGRAVNWGTYAVLFIFTAENFPTIVRSSGLGICNAVGRWSLISVPFLFQYFIYESLQVVSAFFVVINLIGCGLCCILQETFQKTLESE